MEKLKPVYVEKLVHDSIKIQAVKRDSTIQAEVNKILKKELKIED